MKKIYVTNNTFTVDNSNFTLTKLSNYCKSGTGHIVLGDLNNDINDIIVKVVIKTFRKLDRDIMFREMTLNYQVVEKISNFENKIMYYDDKNYFLIYEYLGETLNEKYNLRKLTLKDKLSLFRDFVNKNYELSKHLILHNDIKPNNIVINTDSSNNNNIIMIDYGIAYFLSNDYQSNIDFDTTLWSASPEYYIYAKNRNKNNILNDTGASCEIKEMMIKSQYYGIVGILIGFLLNDIFYHYRSIFKYIKTSDEDNMVIRFMKFTKENIKKYIDELEIKLMEIEEIKDIEKIKEIIFNMLSYEYKNRYSYDEIINKLNNIIDLIEVE